MNAPTDKSGLSRVKREALLRAACDALVDSDHVVADRAALYEAAEIFAALLGFDQETAWIKLDVARMSVRVSTEPTS